MEETFHHLPFLVAGGIASAFLKHSHIRLPLLLTGQRGEASHGCVPVKIERCVNDHHQTGAEDIDFHFQNAYRPYAFQNLRPRF